MTTWKKVVGDVNDYITVDLAGVLTTLVGATVVGHVWTTNTAAETLSASVVDADTIRVELGGATGWLSDAAATTWQIEYQVTYGVGTILTWPEGTPDTIVVRTGY